MQLVFELLPSPYSNLVISSSNSMRDPSQLPYSLLSSQAITLCYSHLQPHSIRPHICSCRHCTQNPCGHVLAIHSPHFLMSNRGLIKLAAFFDEATAVTQNVFCHTLVNDVGGGGSLGCSVRHAAGSRQLRQPHDKSPGPPTLG